MTKKFFSLSFCGMMIGAHVAPIFGCAMMMSGVDKGEKHPFVEVQREDVLIVWDEAGKTEHFVRRIAFGSAKKDFGFVVPVPSVPDVADGDALVFDRLAKKTSPVEIDLPGTFWILGWIYNNSYLRQMITGAAGAMGPEADLPHAAVRVLKTGVVAGQEFSVLEADNASALALWLRDHHYKTRPDLEPWLKKYIDAKWKLVAFKYAPESEASPLTTSAVRLSFKTDRPFFPYREPEDQQAAAVGIPRLLKVYFVGPNRVSGQIGEGQTSWPGKMTYANMTFSANRILAGAIPAVNLGTVAWLTAFEDSSSPRPAKDELYFADRGAIIPVIPMNVVWLPIIPMELLILLMFMIIPFIRWRRRITAPHPPKSKT